MGDFAAGAAVWACIRAEDIDLAESNLGAESANQLRGKITELSSVMNGHRVTLDCGAFCLAVRLERRGQVLPDYRAGAQLTAMVAAAVVHVVRADPV